MAEIIATKNLIKDYNLGKVKVRALNGVDLTIEAGEFVAIMGPSGSGKSTLMHIIGCLDSPTSGEYHLDGVLVSQMAKDDLASIRNSKIGFVFQSFNLLPHLNILKNVELPLMYAGESLRERSRKAREILASVGLSDRLRHKPSGFQEASAKEWRSPEYRPIRHPAGGRTHRQSGFPGGRRHSGDFHPAPLPGQHRYHRDPRQGCGTARGTHHPHYGWKD